MAVGKGRFFIRNVLRVLRTVHHVDPFFLYVGSVIIILATALPYLISWLSAEFINRLSAGNVHSITDPAILYLAVGYILLPFVISQLNLLYSYFRAQFAPRLTASRDDSFLDAQSRLDIQTHEDSEFRNLQIRVRENQYRLSSFSTNTIGLLPSITDTVVSVVILSIYSKYLTLALCVALIPQLFVQLRYGQKIFSIWGARAELRRKYQEYWSNFFGLPYVTEMKVFQSADFFRQCIARVVEQFNAELMRNETRRFIMQSIAAFVPLTVAGVALFFLMRDVISGAIAVGTFIFFASRIMDVRGSLQNLVFAVRDLMTDNLFVTDTFTYLDMPNVLRSGEKPAPKRAPSIEFRTVSFHYPKGEQDILKNISFSVRPGEKVAIVGVNGAGKTTLSKLLMRFYDPTAGEILVNGDPLPSYKMESWYACIGYLSQEYARYHLPVCEAIAIGDTNRPFSRERAIAAAKRSGAHEFITQWPRGYDTPLGKEFDGEEPSMGQWQKLALARLFYKNPDIWILDEPTSSIDAIAELAVFNELENLPDDKTVILISHRFNTVRNADKIIVIEDGKAEEIGTHKELMKLKGTYARLFTAQKKSYEGTAKSGK